MAWGGGLCVVGLQCDQVDDIVSDKKIYIYSYIDIWIHMDKYPLKSYKILAHPPSWGVPY